MTQQNIAREILFGVAIGDALGVPVEFMARDAIRKNPITGMRGHGTHQQLPGTWSDDSSLTFCLAEMLTGRFSLNKLADYFVMWQQDGFWAARGKMFDIGIYALLLPAFIALNLHGSFFPEKINLKFIKICKWAHSFFYEPKILTR